MKQGGIDIDTFIKTFEKKRRQREAFESLQTSVTNEIFVKSLNENLRRGIENRIGVSTSTRIELHDVARKVARDLSFKKSTQAASSSSTSGNEANNPRGSATNAETGPPTNALQSMQAPQLIPVELQDELGRIEPAVE